MFVSRKNGEWILLKELGMGMKTPVTDIAIPTDLKESELETYLDDIYHELASEKFPTVVRVS
jgi:hypothetical protein